MFLLLLASKQVYRPPHARNSDFKPNSLHEETSETSIYIFNFINTIFIKLIFIYKICDIL